jgi:phosphopantetheine binding protein
MATTEEIRAGLADIVNEVAGIPAEDIQLDKSFTDDLDVDSLSMVEVVVAAEAVRRVGPSAVSLSCGQGVGPDPASRGRPSGSPGSRADTLHEVRRMRRTR